MKRVKYLIVGQGIAGTVLAHTLEDEHLDFHIIHQRQPGESSSVAAGIINPITGKYFIKSWQVDTLIPFAEKKYFQWEQKLNSHFYFPRIILRSLHGVSEQNDWLAKTADPSVKHYIADFVDVTPFDWINNEPLGYGQTIGGGQVKWHDFLTQSEDYWTKKGVYTNAFFDYQALVISEDGVQYGDIFAEQIIFCEGYFMLQNPWFNFLPLDGAKGEALLVQIDKVHLDIILKHKFFLSPFSENVLWAGATNKWEFSHFLPDEDSEILLHSEVAKMIRQEYAILKHLVGIRPTVKDRRPLIGRHPVHSRLFIFNGLGTKGTSLAPYWANHFVEFLYKNGDLSKEVSINRFKNK